MEFIKRYCDFCGKEIKRGNEWNTIEFENPSAILHCCKGCNQDVINFIRLKINGDILDTVDKANMDIWIDPYSTDAAKFLQD